MSADQFRAWAEKEQAGMAVCRERNRETVARLSIAVAEQERARERDAETARLLAEVLTCCDMPSS